MPRRHAGPLPRDLAALDALGLARAYQAINDEIDRAYWIFSRTARGAPPDARLYARRRWILEATLRVRSPYAWEGAIEHDR